MGATTTTVVVTPKIRELAVAFRNSASYSDADHATLAHEVQQILENEAFTVSFETVYNLRDLALKQSLPCKLYLHELLQGSHVVKDSPPIPQPHPDLVARRKILKRMVENNEYKRMTKGMDPKGMKNAEAPLDLQEPQRIVSLMLSLLATAGACAAFGYYVTADIITSKALRILAGIASMIIALGAELYFLLKSQIFLEDSSSRMGQRGKENGSSRTGQRGKETVKASTKQSASSNFKPNIAVSGNGRGSIDIAVNTAKVKRVKKLD